MTLNDSTWSRLQRDLALLRLALDDAKLGRVKNVGNGEQKLFVEQLEIRIATIEAGLKNVTKSRSRLTISSSFPAMRLPEAPGCQMD